MKSKKHSFTPTMDGRLEDRIVLNGARAAGIVVNLPGGGRSFVPKEAILTTRTYNSVLVNIHSSFMQFGRTNGSDAAYNRLGRQVGSQLGRLPYARQDGLVDYVTGSLPFYAPSEARIAYSDTRATLIDYMQGKVADGQAAIHKSPGHYFSDADLLGRSPAQSYRRT